MSDVESDEEGGVENFESIEQPQNHGDSPYFHVLVENFFERLVREVSRSSNRDQKHHTSTREARKLIVNAFINNWKKNIGDDIYPAFRLILPELDKERPMYGLKMKNLSKLFCKIFKISPDSADGKLLTNWKVPGQSTKSAGDFAGRVYEVALKRSTMVDYGDLTVDDVNGLLDKLAASEGMTEQQKMLQTFYDRMNPTELEWAVRIMLRQMHIGATMRTILNAYHPDAVNLYNVTSDLKRVCWQLTDRNLRLPTEEQDITLFSCFQPHLAAFPKSNYDVILRKMPEKFIIEEKVDGERIQLHMSHHGGKFMFFSRSGKDYTYLYGTSKDDMTGGLTKNIDDCISNRVSTCILDGEMTAWDPHQEKIVPFGSLKTAANNESKDRGLTHPMYSVFDITYLNGKSLVNYPLIERKKLLNAIIHSREGYFELLPYHFASSKDDISSRLAQAVSDQSEGLVVKNPDSIYHVNLRTEDWIKVKPEYTSEYAEPLDVLILGAYYGSGKRGNILASYLCGLRADDDPSKPMKFYTFCKVGNGFNASEYAFIRETLGDHWKRWSDEKPSPDLINTGAGQRKEAPDVWIEPDKSLVVEVMGSQIIQSNTFAIPFTLRHPRFRRIREDKNWESTLSYNEFLSMKSETDREIAQKTEDIEKRRQKTPRSKKRIIKILNDDGEIKYAKPTSRLFAGQTFYIMSDMDNSKKITRAKLETMVKENGGHLTQSLRDSRDQVIVIADKPLVKVTALLNKGDIDIIRPNWILQCIEAQSLIPIEPENIFSGTERLKLAAQFRVDKYGDSYTRPATIESLTDALGKIKVVDENLRTFDTYIKALSRDDTSLAELPGWMMIDECIFFADVEFFKQAHTETKDDEFKISLKTMVEQGIEISRARNLSEFCGCRTANSIHLASVTHIVVAKSLLPLTASDNERLRVTIKAMSHTTKPPLLVSTEWVESCWKEQHKVDEKKFAVL